MLPARRLRIPPDIRGKPPTTKVFSVPANPCDSNAEEYQKGVDRNGN